MAAQNHTYTTPADILAPLDDGERRSLFARSNEAGLIRLAIHIAGITFFALLVVLRVPLWPLAVPALGICTVFLFTAMHEATHLTAFRSRSLNRAVAAVCGAVLLIPPLWFRAFHFAHHRHTADADRDPELQSKELRTRKALAWHLTGLPLWKAQVETIVRNALGRNREPWVRASERKEIQRESVILLALYFTILFVSIAAGSTAALTLWIIPCLLGQPFLRAYLLAEHAGCPKSDDVFENTRTVNTNVFVRTLAWNMPYHAEHHAWPGIAFHRLPVAHRHCKHALRTRSSGYVRWLMAYWKALPSAG